MQNKHAISLITGVYENKAFRFSIQPGTCEDFNDFPFLGKNKSIRTLTVHKDAEGMLRASKRGLKFLYKPPTGNFQLYLSKKQILSGVVQTGKYDDPLCNFHLQSGARIFGFGAASGLWDRNDQSFDLLNKDTLMYLIKGSSYTSFPFFMIKNAERFTGVLLNSARPFRVETLGDDGNGAMPSQLSITPLGKETKDLGFDFLIFSGTPAEILEQYSQLTARPFLPPLWSLGLHQSRWSYKTQKRVLEIARRYRQEDVPCDCIYLDISYMDRFRVFTWNKKRFPDPEAMHKELGKMGFHTVAITDPGIAVAKDYPVYQECLDKKYYLFKHDQSPYHGFVWPGKTVFADFTRPDVQDWWSTKHKILFDAGVSGIWNDMNDPVLKMGRDMDPLAEDISHKEKTHGQVRNIYANLQAQSTQKSFDTFKKNERSFILTRSASCGIQKYAAVWTGDNLSTWQHLQQNLNMVINLGLSGVPFCGADVGGFGGGHPLPGLLKVLKLYKKKELFSRWVELGSLMPFFRIHSAIYSHNQEPWSFGSAVLENARKHIRRRYRLLPYIYQLFVESSISGSAIVRPMFYDFPNMDCESIQDQFMLGPSILACPVLKKGMQSRKVQLPPGNWYEYESGEKYSGNQSITMPVTWGYYPLFVKAGTALPVWKTANSTKDIQKNTLIWELYNAPDISGTAVIDDGITQDGPKLLQNKIALTARQLKGGDLEIKQNFLEKKYSDGPNQILVRLPTDYRHMIWKKKKIDSQSSDLVSEDRLCKMNEFVLPASNGTFSFPFRSSNFA